MSLSPIVTRILLGRFNRLSASLVTFRLRACMPLCAVALTWAAQVIFWRLVGWQLSLGIDLFWIGLPLCGFALSSLIGVLGGGTDEKSHLRFLPIWCIGAAWIALTIFFTVLGILYKSILFFSVAAMSLGVSSIPLLQQARKRCVQYNSRTGAFIASVGGVSVGLGITEGALFVNQHVLHLIVGLAACLAIARYCLHGRAANQDDPLHASPPTITNSPVANSMMQAGCGILMAGPIALAPSIESLCGLGIAGFGFGLFIHHGVMLLPSLIAYEFRQTVVRYTLTGLYMAGWLAGHAIPLWYLTRAAW
jgi:hypothetical protein